MLDRRDLEPVFFAPFVSSVMKVEPAWIDYNGHLNMAYYNVLFDRAVDEVFELLGCGADYVKRGFSTFTAEVHVRYVRELHEGDPVRVTFQLLDYDAKRMHYFEQLFHAEEGWVSATSENMSLHVDMAAKKTAPFPAEVTRRLIQMKAAHSQLPRPEAAGRSVAMPENLSKKPRRGVSNGERKPAGAVPTSSLRFMMNCREPGQLAVQDCRRGETARSTRRLITVRRPSNHPHEQRMQCRHRWCKLDADNARNPGHPCRLVFGLADIADRDRHRRVGPG